MKERESGRWHLLIKLKMVRHVTVVKTINEYERISKNIEE